MASSVCDSENNFYDSPALSQDPTLWLLPFSSLGGKFIWRWMTFIWRKIKVTFDRKDIIGKGRIYSETHQETLRKSLTSISFNADRQTGTIV